MAVDKNFYNEASATKLGWAPWDFIKGHTRFDNKLLNAIKSFQREHRLLADGMCGPTTYRRLASALESARIYLQDLMVRDGSDVLWYNGEPIAIDWPKDKVHTFSDDNFQYEISNGLSKYTGNGKRPIRSFVNHWDVCLNSKSCARVLARRNVSVHFCIDNNGDIIQLHDLNDMCWHAGNRNVNRTSVGVEISNAYYPKYQNWYERNGFGERPIKDDAWVHGNKLKPFTWFYPVQIEALKALWTAIHEGCGIPLEAPAAKWAYDSACARGTFKGFMSHYHCSRKKIDVAGLDIEKLLSEIKS